jgi:hypothetical protein
MENGEAANFQPTAWCREAFRSSLKIKTILKLLLVVFEEGPPDVERKSHPRNEADRVSLPIERLGGHSGLAAFADPRVADIAPGGVTREIGIALGAFFGFALFWPDPLV